MLTVSPATAAGDPVADADAPADARGIDGMPLIPGMPGVVAPDPNVTDGAGWDGGDEHPATSSTASSTTRAP
jgi:hypothetical protein